MGFLRDAKFDPDRPKPESLRADQTLLSKTLEAKFEAVEKEWKKKFDDLQEKLERAASSQSDVVIPTVFMDGNNGVVCQYQFITKAYTAENVNIKVSQDFLIVTARSEKEGESHDRYIKLRHSIRTPPGTVAAQIKYGFTPEGVLTIQVPCKPPPLIPLSNTNLQCLTSSNIRPKKK